MQDFFFRLYNSLFPVRHWVSCMKWKNLEYSKFPTKFNIYEIRTNLRLEKSVCYKNVLLYEVARFYRHLAIWAHSVNTFFQIYMTPGDFLRSITPGVKQPEHLGLDQFRKFDPQQPGAIKLEEDLPPDSIFFHLGSNGLISFSDYIFLLTILSTSR